METADEIVLGWKSFVRRRFAFALRGAPYSAVRGDDAAPASRHSAIFALVDCDPSAPLPSSISRLVHPRTTQD